MTGQFCQSSANGRLSMVEDGSTGLCVICEPKGWVGDEPLDPEFMELFGKRVELASLSVGVFEGGELLIKFAEGVVHETKNETRIMLTARVTLIIRVSILEKE